VAMCLLQYSLFVQCTATITIFILGTRVDEPQSGECGVVRGDGANCWAQVPIPQHGLSWIPLGFAGGECRASGR
jgi:transglutaminase-like putative cysteine protease